jgi:hypothetical protein
MECEIRLEPSMRAPREARRFVSHHLCDFGYLKLVDNAGIIVAELVTNARAP